MVPVVLAPVTWAIMLTEATLTSTGEKVHPEAKGCGVAAVGVGKL